MRPSSILRPLLSNRIPALGAASADERLARQRSEQEAAGHRARADAEARQHEIERKVLQSQKTESLGVLAGGMVHRFNNLLTSILGNAELAEEYADLVPEYSRPH